MTFPPSVFTPASSAAGGGAVGSAVAGGAGATGSAVVAGGGGDVGGDGGEGSGTGVVAAVDVAVASSAGVFEPPHAVARIIAPKAKLCFMPRQYRTNMRVLFTTVVLLMAVLFTGCPGPTFVVQQYAGPRREPYTLAILRVNGGDSVRLHLLDGEDVRAPIASDARLHIELLPGRHAVSAFDEKDTNRRSPPVSFEGEAGKVYRVVFVGEEAHVVEVDRSSDQPGRDVTLERRTGD